MQFARVYIIEADFEKDFADRLAKELLADPVCEEYYIGRSSAPAGLAKATLMEVHLKSGVTDPVAQSVTSAMTDMGAKPASVRTARKYVLLGELNSKQIDTIARKILANDCIDELMALTAVMDIMTLEGYDLLVLDAAPTGHLIRLLELPNIIEEWLKVFFSLFLKYRNIFRLPGVSGRLVRLSKDLKRLRALLGDPARTALYAVSILTEMSYEETKDLVAACGRLHVPVSGLFLNMATPDGADPLCSSVFKRESAVRSKFEQNFPDINRTVVYRQGDLRGDEKLGAFGQLLFQQTHRAAPGSPAVCNV